MAAQAESTRDQVLHEALDLFSTQGYSKTSLREIAERMDFTKAALYYHFRTKDDLLQELMAPLLDDADALLAEIEGQTQPTGDQAVPTEWVERYITMLLTHRDVAPLLASDLSVLSHPGVGARILAQGERLSVLLAGQDADDVARVRAQAAISVISTAISVSWADDAVVRDELLAATLAVLDRHPAGIAAA